MEKEKLPLSIFVKLCSDKAAFEARLQKKICFRMDQLKQLLESKKDYEILVFTPSIMVIKSRRGAEVTFSNDGRMLIRKIRDIAEAENVAKDILRISLKVTT